MGTVLFGAASACSSGGGSKQASASSNSPAQAASSKTAPTALEMQLGVTVVNAGYPPGHVRRYGAMGNASTDDAGAIEAAIAVTRSSGGGTVTLPPGAYRTGRTVTDRGGSATITLDGAGATLQHCVETGPCLKISGGNFTVTGLNFSFDPAVPPMGSDSSQTAAVYVAGCDRVLIRRCNFERLPFPAVLIHGDTAACSDLAIDSCTFDEVRATAIRVSGPGLAWPVSQVRITSCTFISPATPISAQTRAVHVGEKARDVRITGNNLMGTAAADYSMGWRDGIMIGNGTAADRPQGIIVSFNHITGMADDGIGLAGAQSVSIVGNIITGSLVTSGIYAPANGTWRNSDISISANEIKNHNLAGIFLKDTDGFNVVGNQIQDCNGGVFALDSSVGGGAKLGTIANNTMQRLGNRAIHCETGMICIAGNNILGFGAQASPSIVERSALYVSGVGQSAVISGNIFADGEHGILLSGVFGRLTMTGNMAQTVRGYGAVFIDFTGDEWIITGNHLTGDQGQIAGLPRSPQGIFSNNL